MFFIILKCQQVAHNTCLFHGNSIIDFVYEMPSLLVSGFLGFWVGCEGLFLGGVISGVGFRGGLLILLLLGLLFCFLFCVLVFSGGIGLLTWTQMTWADSDGSDGSCYSLCSVLAATATLWFSIMDECCRALMCCISPKTSCRSERRQWIFLLSYSLLPYTPFSEKSHLQRKSNM